MIVYSKNALGFRVREMRKERGYTKEQLAEMAEISTGFLGDIESRKKGVSADTLSKLAAALRVSADYLLYGEEKDCYLLGQLIAAVDGKEQQYLESLFEEGIRILDDLKQKATKKN